MGDDIEIEVGQTTKIAYEYTAWAIKGTILFLAYSIAALTGLAVLIIPVLFALATVPANAPTAQQVTQLGFYGLIWYYTARPVGMKILRSIQD